MASNSKQVEGLRFQLKAIAGLDELLTTDYYNHVDLMDVDMVLDQSAKFAEEQLAPLAVIADQEGCQVEDGVVKFPEGTREVFDLWLESGVAALDLPVSAGGMGIPHSVLTAQQEISDAANLSFGMHPTCQRGAARLAITHGENVLPQVCIENLVSGKWAATIAISEPQAGSDVGRILTKAKQDENEKWIINGTKCWISYGSHDLTEQIIHFILARDPDGDTGTRGISLFAVGKHRMDADGNLLGSNGVRAASIENKMGMHGSPTCVMEYENCEAVLLGERCRGLQAMFTMVKSMRLGTAVQGVAAAAEATKLATDYAMTRPQGGRSLEKAVPIIEHMDVKRMLLEMHARTETTRAFMLRIARYLDLHDASDDATEKNYYAGLADLLLPVAKTFAAETGFDVANIGIQIHGGYGYTADYVVERLARDVRVTAIYEGTSGIQSIDLVMRKLESNDGATMDALVSQVTESLNHADNANPVKEVLQQGLAGLETLNSSMREYIVNDTNAAMSGSYAYLKYMGWLVTAWSGIDLYRAATGDTVYEKRIRAAMDFITPRISTELYQWSKLAQIGARKVNVPADIFDDI